MTDQTQARRRSFNDNADNYRLARPAYPQDVFDLLVERCGLTSGTQILEVGAGTGLATRELLARGATVLAVEPGADLAAHLVADLGCERLEVLVDTIEAAPLPDSRFDLAVSATSFHWVNTQVALPRIAAALHPGGSLAVWWTVFGDAERPIGFRAALTELYERYLPSEVDEPDSVPRPMQVEARTAELEQGGWFQVVDVKMIRWTHQLTGEGARMLFGSFPNIAMLDTSRRTEFLDRIADLIDTKFGGMVADPYVTVVYLAHAQLAEP